MCKGLYPIWLFIISPRFQHLSKRSLVFINDMVYFKCQRCVWREDRTFDKRPLKTSLDQSDMITIALEPDTHPFSSYENLLLYYNQKELTKAEDRLNTIAGLFSLLEIRMKCQFLEGLPIATLDASLLYILRSPESKENLPSSERRGIFPSYSWAGWSGVPDWSHNPDFSTSLVFPQETIANNKWLDTRTWIIWYRRSTDGALTLLRDHKALCDESSTILGYRRRNAAPFQTKSRYHLPTKPKIRLPPEKGRTYCLLQFWTVIASYALIFESVTKAWILDRDQRRCGYLRLDEQLPITANSKYEVLILSESQAYSSLATQKGLAKKTSSTRDNGAEAEGKEGWDFYWVILIVRDGEVAERRGGSARCIRARWGSVSIPGRCGGRLYWGE
jgi:hypothetical protein